MALNVNIRIILYKRCKLSVSTFVFANALCLFPYAAAHIRTTELELRQCFNYSIARANEKNIYLSLIIPKKKTYGIKKKPAMRLISFMLYKIVIDLPGGGGYKQLLKFLSSRNENRICITFTMPGDQTQQ